MALVDPSCFPGLSPEERRQQLYEALYGLVGDTSLTDPACFAGQSQDEQDFALYAALAGSACWFGLSREERFEALYLAAGGTDTCFIGRSREEQGQLFYEVFYNSADDPTLVSPECFPGLSPLERAAALFAAIENSSGGEGQFFFDSTTLTWDSTTTTFDAA